MSFELNGLDDDGVVAFTGISREPSVLEWLAVLALGIAFLTGVAAGTIAALMNGEREALVVALPVGLVFGRLTVGGAVWWLRVRRKLSGLASLQELSARTGLDETTLQTEVKEAGVKPVYRVNRVDLYDPAEFRAGSLLRTADTAEMLVRTARQPSADSTLVQPFYGIEL